ncbi:MAG: hypothetical protein RL685_531 [Pseudomonadota bacterium]|jgi:hypothetical protein
MSESSSEPLAFSPMPEFGAEVQRAARACTPRELFCRLFVELEENVHFLLPAFELAVGQLERTALPPLVTLTSEAPPEVFADALVAWANSALPAPPLEFAWSWPARVAREFAPVGLADGVWLRGSTQANTVESETGMRQLRQFMLRFGDPGTGEAYAQRYAALLKSLGMPPESITRWEWQESLPCTELSYEHALVGLTLGLFPGSLGLETVGFNLWMASVGPCPLLTALAPQLQLRNACLRYLELYDSETLAALARQAVVHACAEQPGAHVRQRIARGFAAAQRSYLRWHDAMCGRNVPLTPREFVLESVRRKARFSAEHHGDVRLGQHNIQELMLAGGDEHELLLDALAASPLVQPGAPDKSRLLTHSLSIDGPMFDAFTAGEINDLREWIAALPASAGSSTNAAAQRPAVLELEGKYTAPQEPESLAEFAFARYGALSNSELYCCFANADLHPAIYVFGRVFVEGVMQKLSKAFADDERLNSKTPPPYSEKAIAEMVAEQHVLNVRSRLEEKPESDASGAPDAGNNPDAASNPNAVLKSYIGAIFDGCWLQGFADVQRAGLEEYGWLFRIYASEHGDGRMDWNHCRIFRHAFAALGPDIFLPKTDLRLYQLFDVAVGSLAKLAVSLNTRRFLPEILGTNLGIEAAGVGGTHFQTWKEAEGEGATWKALAHRLHNSIDNYADGHTKWSLAAVQAFMRRVKDAAPADVDAQWHRLWRMWRLLELMEHGSETERKALSEHIDVTTLGPA